MISVFQDEMKTHPTHLPAFDRRAATVEAVVVQSRVMAEVLDPERIYEPVTEFLDVQPAPIARLERELARARYKICLLYTSPSPRD